MGMVGPDASVKDPHLNLGPTVALLPQLLCLKAGSDAVLGQQQPPLSVLRQATHRLADALA